MHGFWKDLAENWPVLGTLAGGVGVLIMWTKKQFLDNVFATKKEVRALEQHLDQKLDQNDRRGMERHIAFQKEIAANHSELKTLIIHHLDKR